jgi:ribosomal-protein-alanine N-acetyltransferase
MAEPLAVCIDRIVEPGDADIHAVAALQRTCFGRDWGLQSLRELMTAAHAMMLLARTGRDGEAVSFLLARTLHDEAEVLALGVHEGERRRGVPSGLLQECQRWAAAEGASRLLLEVAETNEAAREAYRARGFSEVGRRARYYAPLNETPYGGATGGRRATDALILCALVGPSN